MKLVMSMDTNVWYKNLAGTLVKMILVKRLVK